MTRASRILVLVVALVSIAGCGPHRSKYRRGTVVGTSIGGSVRRGCADCDPRAGLSVTGHVGRVLSVNNVVALEGSVLWGTNAVGLSFQRWLGRVLSLRLGAVYARTYYDPDRDNGRMGSHAGFGGQLVIGFDWFTMRTLGSIGRAGSGDTRIIVLAHQGDSTTEVVIALQLLGASVFFGGADR